METSKTTEEIVRNLQNIEVVIKRTYRFGVSFFIIKKISVKVLITLEYKIKRIYLSLFLMNNIPIYFTNKYLVVI